MGQRPEPARRNSEPEIGTPEGQHGHILATTVIERPRLPFAGKRKES